MTVTTVTAAMQVINVAISGVTTAPVLMPGSLETADLPAVIVWPSEADTHQSAGFKVSTRSYVVALYVMPAEQGLGISEGWTDAKTLLQTLLETWASEDNVILISAGGYNASVRPDDDTPILDNGIEMIAYPPPAQGVTGYPHYFGAQLRVTVKETWST